MFRGGIVIALIAFAFQMFSLSVVDSHLKESEGAILYNMPASILKIGSLEFSSLYSDIMFLNLRAFVGKSLEGESRTIELSDSEWAWFSDRVFIISDLDDQFYDNYYFGSTILSIKPSFVDRNLLLLQKATSSLPDEWYFPFLEGWLYYFQKSDNLNAAKSLQESYRRDTRNTLLASFASRLLYQGNRTENAIVFLKSLISENKNSALNKSYEMRLELLQKLYYIEQLRDRFYQQNGYYPMTLDLLVKKGYLSHLPVDPFGGDFYIDDSHQIKTTSDLGAAKIKK